MKTRLKNAAIVAGKGAAGLLFSTLGLYGVSWLLNKVTSFIMAGLSKLFAAVIGSWGMALLLVALLFVGIIMGELLFSGSWKKLWKKKDDDEPTYE